MEHRRDVVLFLGAGFARPAGLPVMGEFWPASQIDLGRLRIHAAAPPSDRDHRLAAAMLVDAGEGFGRFRDFCLRSGCITEAGANNVETIYSMAEAMRAAQLQQVNLSGSVVGIDEVHRQIRLWLWKVYQQAPWASADPRALANRGGKAGVNASFVRQVLQTSSLPARLTLITTNYDLLIEHLVWQAKAMCAYPLSSRSARSFNCCGDGPGFVTLDPAPTLGATLPICKLHGSVNFFSLDEASFEGLHVAVDIGDGKSRVGRSTGRAEPDRPPLFYVDAIEEIRRRYPKMTPVFVPPTFSKNFREAWFVETWEAAFKAIVSARSIIFIGYSLPESDAYLRATLQGAIACRGDIAHPRIFVIDPSSGTLDRFASVFPWAALIQSPVEEIVGANLADILSAAVA